MGEAARGDGGETGRRRREGRTGKVEELEVEEEFVEEEEAVRVD